MNSTNTRPLVIRLQLNQLCLKLAQETHIVFRKQPEVLDFVLEVGDALNTHTKCKTTVFPGINPTVSEHIRIHHTAAQYFYPTASLAHCATFTFTNGTADVHLGGR